MKCSSLGLWFRMYFLPVQDCFLPPPLIHVLSSPEDVSVTDLGSLFWMLVFDAGLTVWSWQMKVVLLCLFYGSSADACKEGQGRPCSWIIMEGFISQNTLPRLFKASTAAIMIVMFCCVVSWKTSLKCSQSSSISWNFWSSLCTMYWSVGWS